MPRSIVTVPKSVESVLKKKRKVTVGRICRKGRFYSKSLEECSGHFAKGGEAV